MEKCGCGLGILVAVIVLSGFVVGARGAFAACGDGILDPDEQCDHGAANGQDACCSVSCQLVDADYDGTCDALDPCPDGQGTRIKESKLGITRLATGPGDDGLRLVGTIVVPNTPSIDPAVSGVRLRMFAPGGDPRGSAIVDASLPGGPQWMRRPGGAAWTYRDPKGGVAGIRRLVVKLLPPLVPTTRLTKVAFSVMGRRGSYAVTPEMVTSYYVPPSGLPEGSFLQVTMAIGTPSNQQCGEVWYSTVVPTHCDFSTSGDRVTCGGPPPVGPCHIGDPDDLMICDVLNAAHAEEQYFAAHGTYYGGSCTGLPGFVPSPGVTCTVSGSSTNFTVATSHPSALHGSCTWTGNPGPSAQNLICG